MIQLQTQTSNYVVIPAHVEPTISCDYFLLMDKGFTTHRIGLLFIEGDSRRTKFLTEFISSDIDGTRECTIVRKCTQGEEIIYNGIAKITNYYENIM